MKSGVQSVQIRNENGEDHGQGILSSLNLCKSVMNSFFFLHLEVAVRLVMTKIRHIMIKERLQRLPIYQYPISFLRIPHFRATSSNVQFHRNS